LTVGNFLQKTFIRAAPAINSAAEHSYPEEPSIKNLLVTFRVFSYKSYIFKTIKSYLVYILLTYLYFFKAFSF
jgi:hypothetical protein